MRVPVTGGLAAFDRVRFRVSASAPMRVWVQLRAPVGNTERWGKTFYTSTEPGLIEVAFADFLPIMKSGVQRFAPHVRQVAGAALGTPALDAVIDQSDVVVLSTGAESVLPRLRPGVRAIEYRHSPDPVDVDQQIVPLLSPEGVAEPQEAVP